MSDLSVFYAWQSDLPKKTNRFLIRAAALESLKRLTKDSSLEDSPRLDSDTQGVSGTPEISATLFDKIDRCGIFLADLSFVGKTIVETGEPKKLPNPNVLLELGYAAAQVGWGRIICVMNTAYGTPSDLIFDLRHRRWPITFELLETDTEQFSCQRKKLSDEIEFAIRAAIQAEHASVLNLISRLDLHCLRWMQDLGSQNYFRAPERRTAGEILAGQQLDNALVRLLELGLLRCDVDPNGKLYAYHWTYHGKLVLEKLKFRKSKELPSS